MTYRPSLDDVYLRMLDILARRSTCARRQVAAILVDQFGRYVGSGYNGVPIGFPHCTDLPCEGSNDPHGDNRNCMAVHAEQNAIMNSFGPDAVDTVYCSCTPCFECAKLLANLRNLKRVVVNEPYADKRGLLVFQLRGIQVEDASQSISDESLPGPEHG
jgi:dCMP deaminase